MNLRLDFISVYPIFVTLAQISIILALIHMIYKRRNPTTMISWILFMILIPYLAVFLYFIFGTRKRFKNYGKEHIKVPRKQKTIKHKNAIDSILLNNGLASPSAKEKLLICTDYVQAYLHFLKHIKNAKTSIYISTYVFKYDETTKEILKALEEKLQEGLEVKILLDSLGSWKTYLAQGHFKTFKKLGGELKFFMPILKMPFRNYINLRNHRKIYLFDKKIVLSGGMNLSKDYLGKKHKAHRWKDMLFLCEGASVGLYLKIFSSDWYYATKQTIDIPHFEDKTLGNTLVQVIPSGPDVPNDVLFEALICAIYSSKKRIWIVTPYFVPNEALSQALIVAKHRGLEVKVISPQHSNNFLADLTRSSFLRELKEHNVDVHLYKGSMLHAKAVLFDSSWVMLGSVNLDNRSLFLNYEVATFVSSEQLIKQVELWMNDLLANSTQNFKKASLPRIMIENLMRVIAPQM